MRARDIRLDITDLYVFRGEVGTVLNINVCHSIFGKIPVPGFHPEGMYEFKIDLDGDSVEDTTYRVTFDESDASGKQRYVLQQIAGKNATDPSARGDVIATGTTGETSSTKSGIKIWAGKAGDPFSIEPDVLHAVGHAFEDGTKINLEGWDPSKAKNLFAGHTVYSLVLEIPDAELSASKEHGGKIGVWAVATLATDAGGWHSINRVGLPMIHPLFTQYNEDLGNRLNAGNPADDFATYGETVSKAVAGVVAANGTSEDPAAYGEYVAHRFFPNILRYRVGTPATFGFAEWNGRSLTDNAPDVMFSFASNSAVTLGIRKRIGDVKTITCLPVRAVGELSPNGRTSARCPSHKPLIDHKG